MSDALSAEQRQLQVEARRLFSSHAARVGTSSQLTWEQLVGLGWQATAIETRFGGAGAGVVDLTAVLLEAGRSLLDLPLLSTAGLAAPFLSAAGDDAFSALNAITTGTAATLAFHDAAGRSLTPGQDVVIEGRRLTGVRGFVPDAEQAGVLVVPVSVDGEFFVAVVRPGSGTQVVPSAVLDPQRPVSTVVFDCPDVGVSRMSRSAFTGSLATALSALAAELVGLADGALGLALAHAKTRVQFGAPIGSFQALKHRLVDSYVAVEKARSLLFASAAAIDRGLEAHQSMYWAALAKATASEAALFTARTSVQVHAAAALTADHPALRYLRRARQTSYMLGDPLPAFTELGEECAKNPLPVEPGGLDEREAVREFLAWLDDQVPQDYGERFDVYRFDHALRTRYQKAAFDAGWLLPDWPADLGGRATDATTSLALRVAGARRSAPKLCCVQAVGVVAPTLRDFGSQQQQGDLLVPTLRGDLWWALGMSEPDAGSDLARLTTRARRCTDGFRISGQKTWTTQARESQWCMLFAKTDTTASAHRGISCFLLEMSTPGISVRPLIMASGTDEVFCDVFFDDVWVPQCALLGGEGDGWRIAKAALRYERDMVWVMNLSDALRALEQTRRALSKHADRALLTQLGRTMADASALVQTGYRVAAHVESEAPAKEGYILKLIGSELLQQAWALAATAGGVGTSTDRGLWLDYMDSLAATIYGGTSEIQRNVIADRVLELPRHAAQ